MKLEPLLEVRYATKGLILSVRYTLMDPAATQEKPYIFFKYGDVHYDKIPRKSTFFESIERANQFIQRKRDALDKKISDLEANPNEDYPITHADKIKRVVASRGIMDRVKVVSITTKYET